MAAAVSDRAQPEGNLDASYTISFARIPVGEITATVVFGDSEYAISARARAGGVMKVLSVDGEGSSPRVAPSRTATPCREFSPPGSSRIRNFRCDNGSDEGSVRAPRPHRRRVMTACQLPPLIVRYR